MGCISRFLEANGISLCRDQVYRLVAIAISVCAKFWDEGAVGEGVNLNFVSATGIPLEDYNAMEISFLSSLGWKLKMEEEEFDEWAGKIEVIGGACLHRHPRMRTNYSSNVLTTFVSMLNSVRKSISPLRLDGRALFEG